MFTKSSTRPIVFLVSFLVLAGCESTHQNIGTVSGTVIGGVVGNQFGNGAGRTAATILGALAGGIIGREIGVGLDQRNQQHAVNAEYIDRLEACGVIFSGLSPDGSLPEIVELRDHPWFIGVQYHPELKSRPFAPHPLFASFIKAAIDQSRLV